MKIAAIDIGSNAARMQISKVLENDGQISFKKVEYVRFALRLGHDVFNDGEISPESEVRIFKLLNAYMPETAPGKMARGIVLNGKVLGISSRALGSVFQDQSGYDVVEDDLEIICWDLVSRPSTYDANLRLTEAQKKGKVIASTMLTETKCFGDSCNIITSKKIIKESKFKSLSEEDKVYVECLGVERFLQLKNK